MAEARLSLIPYLDGDDGEIRYNILRLYIDLGGEVEQLKSTLYKATDYFRNTLIEEFIKKAPTFIITYLKDRLNKESDEQEKLTISKYLINLQVADGVIYYTDFIRRHKYVPDDSHANPLILIREVGLTSLILHVFLLSKDPTIKFNKFNNLSSIAINSLTNVALYQQNFKIVKRQFDRWILVKRVKSILGKPVLTAELLDDLHFYWEIIEQQYYSQRTAVLSTTEAIMAYNKIRVSNSDH